MTHDKTCSVRGCGLPAAYHPVIKVWAKVNRKSPASLYPGLMLCEAHKAMELYPELASVKVKEVQVVRVERIDRSRYTGEMLRKLRSERGVGRAR